MRGIVLAAGGGTRLHPLTEALPKTLLEVDGRRTILDRCVANLAEAGLDHVVVVAGHAAERIHDVIDELATTHEVDIEVVFNPRFETANNAYSLWWVREHLRDGALIVNGDTLHPSSVEDTLLAVRGQAPIILAIDAAKTLADEEMKVELDHGGGMQRISKQLDPRTAAGEYIGVALIEPDAVVRLADALERTWSEDPGRWYEDGFQRYVDDGGRIGTAPIGAVDWVEVDDHDDLARARAMFGRGD